MSTEQGRFDEPFVSIVIPARNEAGHLGQVLTALDALDYPPASREVLVVDNGSTDETVAVARRAGARVLFAPGVNVGEVRNTGARAARGEILAFLDADCVVGPRWLSAAVTALADARTGAVGGNCDVAAGSNWVQRAWVVEQPPGSEEAATLATASFIVRRRTFEELGGFDASLGAGEDDDLSRRVRAAGYRLQRIAQCSVIHLGYPETLHGVLRRQLWHGRSQLRVGAVDPMVVLTHLFALLCLAVPVAMVAGAWSAAAESAVGTLLLAGLPAWRKERRAGGVDLLRLGQRTVVYWWFLLGRAGGLALGYGDGIARWRRPVREP